MQSRNEASNNKSLDDLIKEMYTDILPFIDGSPDELIRALGLALDSDTCGYFQWNIHRFLRDLSPLLDTAKKLGNKPKLPEDASMRLAIIGEKFNSLFSLMLDMLQKDSEHVIENKIKEFLGAKGIPEDEITDNFVAVVNTWGHVLNLEAFKEVLRRSRKAE